jgi:hypothetical protein
MQDSPTFVEAPVKKTERQNICPYCGLKSAVWTNHASTDECIAALQREANRLRECLVAAAHVAESSSHDNARAIKPRLAPIRAR